MVRQILIDDELVNSMNEGIEFLRPYFKLDSIDKKPKLGYSETDKPYFDTYNNIKFPRSLEGLPDLVNIIGHEAGHFIHHYINPAIWGILSIYSNALIEAVAIYSEAIYVTKGDFVLTEKEMRFSLPGLARMNHSNAHTIYQEMIEFHSKMLKLYELNFN